MMSTNPMLRGNLETIDQAIFDTVYLPPKGNRAIGFTICFGQNVQTSEGWKVKDWTDTNLLQPGMLDAPKTLGIDLIDCYLVSGKGVLPGTSRWYADISMELQVNRKTMWHGPLLKCINPIALFSKKLLGSTELDEPLLIEIKEQFQKCLSEPISIHYQEPFNAVLTLSDWACKQYQYMSWWQRRMGSLPDKCVISLNGKLQRAIL